MKLNINDTVRVTLTEDGARYLIGRELNIARQYGRPVGTPLGVLGDCVAGATWSGPIWDAMHVFGPEMRLGCGGPILSGIEVQTFDERTAEIERLVLAARAAE